MKPSPVPIETRRAVSQTQKALWDVLTRGDRDIGPSMSALVGVFRALWRMVDDGSAGQTPTEAFKSLNALYDRGEMGISDDPARGRYVHPEHDTVQ